MSISTNVGNNGGSRSPSKSLEVQSGLCCVKAGWFCTQKILTKHLLTVV